MNGAPATPLNTAGREALRLIDLAAEAFTGGETWTEAGTSLYPGSTQWVHWRTAGALVHRGYVTSTFEYEDDNGERAYRVYRLELTDTGRAALAGFRPQRKPRT